MPGHYWSECKIRYNDSAADSILSKRILRQIDDLSKLQADSEYKTVLEEARQGAKQTAKDEQKQRVKTF